jgi:nitrite reductase/ring-hydroxylating ferredoxin subunit
MLSKKVNWYKVADNIMAIDWQNNNMAVVEAGDKKITLVKLDTEISACARKCPHAGGEMADGFVDALGNISCPLHRYKFSLHNGRNVSGEGYYLKVYKIEQRADGVFVGVEESNWLNGLV